jgi:hypothetical protein
MSTHAESLLHHTRRGLGPPQPAGFRLNLPPRILIIQAQFAEGGAAKIVAPNYLDTLTVTIGPTAALQRSQEVNARI